MSKFKLTKVGDKGYTLQYDDAVAGFDVVIFAADLPDLSEAAFSALCEMNTERMARSADESTGNKCVCTLQKCAYESDQFCGLAFNPSPFDASMCGNRIGFLGRPCAHDKACHAPPQGAKP